MKNFTTENTPLAVTLATCGVPIDEELGIEVVYSENYLREHGFTSALQAEAANAQGSRCYHFLRTDELPGLLTAWDTQQKVIAKLDRGGVDTASEIAIAAEMAMRFGCQLWRNRRVLLSARGSRNWLRVQTGDNAFAMVTTNASRQLRREAGL